MNFYHRLFHITKNSCKLRYNTKINAFPCQSLTNGALQVQHNFSTSKIDSYPKKNKDGLLKSIVSKIPFINLAKSRLKVTGFLLYESVADNISYADFFKTFSLPDTFYSWFIVTELHIWMLLVRTMSEGDDGRFTRNSIVQALWTDVNTRAKKLGAANPSGIRMQVDELSQQFQAALIMYDEGLLSDDKTLASALWRRFFQQNCDCPENVELLLQYVRKQIKFLDDLTTEELLEKRQISWRPLTSK